MFHCNTDNGFDMLELKIDKLTAIENAEKNNSLKLCIVYCPAHDSTASSKDSL